MTLWEILRSEDSIPSFIPLLWPLQTHHRDTTPPSLPIKGLPIHSTAVRWTTNTITADYHAANRPSIQDPRITSH